MFTKLTAICAIAISTAISFFSPAALAAGLVITNVQVSSVTSTTAAISFNSSSGIGAYGGLSYNGPATNGWTTVGDSNGLSANHTVTLTGLAANATYQFVAFAYEGSSNAQSSLISFTTTSTLATPNAAVRYIGRWDFSDPAGARASWSGSAVRASFTGTSVSATIYTQDANDGQNPYYTAIVDGGVPTRLQGTVGTYTYPITSGLPNGAHTVQISREFEGWNGVTQFISFNIGGGQLLAPPAPAKLQMEVIGDSITAGYGNVGPIGYPALCSGVNTNNESSYMAYGSVLGRMIGADVSTIAYTGIGIYRNNLGQTDSPTTPTMDEFYLDTLTYGSNLGIDLHQYTYPASGQVAQPMDIVIVDLGGNDLAQGMPTAAEYETSYKTLIHEIRENSPNAQIFLTLGPMDYDPNLSIVRGYLNDLLSYYASLGDTNIHQVNVDGQDPSLGVGCDYHPSTAEHLRMAQQIGNQIQQILGISVSSTDPNPLLSW